MKQTEEKKKKKLFSQMNQSKNLNEVNYELWTNLLPSNRRLSFDWDISGEPP